jgi:hypothetical protein
MSQQPDRFTEDAQRRFDKEELTHHGRRRQQRDVCSVCILLIPMLAHDEEIG